MKKSARKLQPWSFTWNLKIRPCKVRGFHGEKTHPFSGFQGVVYENPPTCSQLQWSWRLEPSKIQNLNSSLVTSILFSQPFLKTKHQNKTGVFLFTELLHLQKEQRTHLIVGCGKLLICCLVISLFLHCKLPDCRNSSLLPHMKLWRNPKRDNGLTDTHHQVLHQRCRCISFTATYNIEQSE